MIIRGILDSSLNGQLCIRGYAPIKELARISEANYGYQRTPIENREDILFFLENEPYLFFPEIILSYKLKHTFEKANSYEAPIKKIQLNKSFKSNIDKTQVKIKSIDYKGENDVRNTSKVNVIELNFDDDELNTYIAKGQHPFQRIDGNHRLKDAQFSEADSVKNMVAPFCIILGEEFYVKNEIDPAQSTDFDKSVKVFFHNINTKTIPLTSEENLRVIIDDAVNFPDDELEKILGTAGLKTRKLKDKIDPAHFTGIEHILSKQYRTYYKEVFWQLLNKGESKDTIVDKVLASLKAIDLLYQESDNLKANSSFGLLTAFLYYHVEGNKAKFEYFKNWVLSNNIANIPEIKAESIIKIFDKIAEKNLTVFVAMPYYEDNPEIMEGFNAAYERVINRIRATYPHVSISLYPIMQYEGKTRDIIQNMINEINNCSIVIADITGGNPNVGYELGIARALKKPTIIMRKENDKDKVPFDYDHDVRNPYKENAINTLEDEAYNNIVAILRDDFGVIIENN
jgi:hypothetical protein